MKALVAELVLTAVAAAGFVAVGELLLGRRSADVAETNEALWTGMGLCAAALFPLSLIVGARALVSEAAAIAVCLAVAVIARLIARPPASTKSRRRVDPVEAALHAGTALAAAGFVALNFRFTYLWDGMLIWATKAQLLFQNGRLTREWFPGDVYDLRHLAYPPLVSFYEALTQLGRGAFDFDRTKPIFLVFYLSMLVGTHAAARALVSARAAAAATLLVAWLPQLSTATAAGAYADMPQAAAVAALAAAALRRRVRALPWTIGALTVVKAEGTILAGFACLAVLLAERLENGPGAARRWRSHVGGAAIVGGFFAARVGYVRWIGAGDVYGGGLSAAVARVPVVIRGCARELFDPKQWGLFWIAFAFSAVVLLRRGSGRERALAASIAAVLAVLTVPFLVTTWPVELQISQAYSRLASQLAPAAAAAIVAAFAAARGRSASPVLT